jgi:hypothetical protein
MNAAVSSGNKDTKKRGGSEMEGERRMTHDARRKTQGQGEREEKPWNSVVTQGTVVKRIFIQYPQSIRNTEIQSVNLC